jgi:DNA-3-methyladenine glycosylase
MKYKKLPRSFYIRPTLTVAKDLLGKYFVRKLRGKTLVGKIVEVEAYLGERDPASHAFRGMTARNDVMFREGGHLYVYFTYGMHYCCNVVTEGIDKGRAVLIRAVEPVEGIDLMMRNRFGSNSTTVGNEMMKSPRQRMARFKTVHHSEGELSNGPAKLCQAFGITKDQNGIDLLGEQIFVATGDAVPSPKIAATTRIGIKNGKEKKWRYFLPENPFISRKVIHKKRGDP